MRGNEAAAMPIEITFKTGGSHQNVGLLLTFPLFTFNFFPLDLPCNLSPLALFSLPKRRD
jgi:hypothetical protein